MLGERLSVYVGAGRGDLAVSGSSSPEVEYGNMEQLSAVQTSQGSSVNSVINTSVFYTLMSSVS